MIPIAKWMWLRFIRLWLWVPALIIPLLLFVVAVARRGEEPVLAHKALLDFLYYLLPALAILTVLTAVDPSRWALDVTRPTTFRRIFIGVWLGGLAPFAACHALLLAAGLLVGPDEAALASGRDGSAVSYVRDVTFWRGTPAAPQPGPAPRPLERLEWLELDAPWTFEVRGVPLRRSDEPLRGRLLASVGRAVVVTAGETRHASLYRTRGLAARLRCIGDDGADRCEPIELVLDDGRIADFEIPASAVLDDGRLLAVLERLPETSDDGGESHAEHDAHDHESEEGDLVVWFEGALQGGDGEVVRRHEPRLDERGNPSTGLLVVGERRSLRASFFRLGVLAAGLLPLVVALASFASLCFGTAVAFAFDATLFVCGVSMGFLREIVESLSIVSSVILFGDPMRPQLLRRPSVFDRALESFLNFWIDVLPDFTRFHGTPFLLDGELADWSLIGRSVGLALVYVACFWGAASLLLLGWQARR